MLWSEKHLITTSKKSPLQSNLLVVERDTLIHYYTRTLISVHTHTRRHAYTRTLLSV